LTEERKGIKYLLESLKIFYSKLSDVQRKEVLLVVAGSHAEQLQERACFDTLCIGYVSYDLLPLYYSMANIFLSPSIDDAGLSMVNQSLSCGTPVVSFNIGTALDMILNENTGYCANRCDSDDFAQGIMCIYNSTEDQYENMCKCCRRVAIEKTSEKSFVDNFLRIYTKYKS
jgi:glycosyltransferase involved in cell wall biosynthesis